MKKITFIILLLLVSCQEHTPKEQVEKDINITLNNWHKAAAEANFDNYFNLMTDDAVFIGTDATENWQLEAFKAFSKPYFDKGKAWSFTALERHIYCNQQQNLAWFDELLDTQMEICRGSGVMQLTDEGWKVKHYVLSMTIPNPDVKNVVSIKKETDSLLKKALFLKMNK